MCYVDECYYWLTFDDELIIVDTTTTHRTCCGAYYIINMYDAFRVSKLSLSVRHDELKLDGSPDNPAFSADAFATDVFVSRIIQR